MLLDDFIALLWAYGGNIGSRSGRVDPEVARRPELFLLAASKFISVDARLSTCIFNLIMEMASRFSAHKVIETMVGASYEPSRLGLLVTIIRKELEKHGALIDMVEWTKIERELRESLTNKMKPQPLLPHLPSLPGRRDPTFLSWGFEYPGIVREPDKYLRKDFVVRPADAI